QPADMNVDGASFDIDIGAPDRVEQLFAREYAARMLHQLIEQTIFRRPEMDVPLGAPYAMAAAVDGDLAHGDDVLDQTRPHAAHDGAHAGQQLAHREWLDDVVIGAGIEAANAVGLFAARSQHHDGDIAKMAAPAQPAADFYARKLRQHPIEQHEIGIGLIGE